MLLPFFRCLVSAFWTRRELALENLALRQQLAVLRRSVKRPRVSVFDRGFWVVLSRIWRDWRRSLVLVKPETVIRWHRSGFRRYWTWKSRRRRPGRPPIDPEVRAPIRKMSEANPRWGAPRVHGELRKIGIDVSQAGVQVHGSASKAPVPDMEELSRQSFVRAGLRRLLHGADRNLPFSLCLRCALPRPSPYR